MKIELTELPTIRDLLEELQNNVWTAEQLSRPMAHPTTEFKVEDREYNETRIITHAELLGIFQARVEAQTKHLRQRYQIDFTPAPTLAIAVNVNPAAPPARNPAPTGGLTEANENDLDAE
ncbi:hypothetical protein [Clavibacter phage 33]|nr:hypothetical protein [Clavibacter phage 33]